MKNEDFETFEKTRVHKPKLSVIVPVYNETRELESFLDWWDEVPGKRDMELIICVAKSGEHDNLVMAAEKRARTMANLKPSRALQMNRGAEAAKGDYLFFVHADSRPPSGFRDIIVETLSSPGRAAGVFSHRFRRGGGFALGVISYINRLRYSLTGVYYGDQGLFLRTADFKTVGGFDDLPLLEDIAMIKKLRKRGEVALSKKIMRTSGRRFLKNGAWRTFFLIWYLLLRDFLGLDIRKQAELYRKSG